MFKQRLVLPFLFILLMWGRTAYAETDYRCLKTCMTKEGAYHICKPKCAIKPKAKKRQGDALVKTPRPVDKRTMLEFQKERAARLYRKDYGCLRSCLQNRNQYSFCEQKCQEQE